MYSKIIMTVAIAIAVSCTGLFAEETALKSHLDKTAAKAFDLSCHYRVYLDSHDDEETVIYQAVNATNVSKDTLVFPIMAYTGRFDEDDDLEVESVTFILDANEMEALYKKAEAAPPTSTPVQEAREGIDYISAKNFTVRKTCPKWRSL